LAPVILVLAARVGAGTAYVSDELVLGVYAEPNSQGQRLATLHSGATLETLVVNGEFTQVRLGDGTSGWVKSSYLTTQEPVTVRLKQLQDELDRSRATTPALAEAAARSEVEQLKRELKDRQSELNAARGVLNAPAGGAPAPGNSGAPAEGGPAPDSRESAAAARVHAWVWVPALLAALACGFWLGYATLARRVRHKFGGIKVY
jgi:uncharacterized protein YgiM (DUF1202 family)